MKKKDTIQLFDGSEKTMSELGPIMLSNYCIKCIVHRAMVIYKGNSLCMDCFKVEKEKEKVKK